MAFTKINAAGIGSTELVTLHSLEVLNNATVGGVLTYEDVTNVDSVGLITARNGIVVGSGITLSKDGDIFATGISTFGSLAGATIKGNILLNESDPKIFFNDGGSMISNANVANTLAFFSDGSNERVRIHSSGFVGIGTDVPNSYDSGGRTLVLDQRGTLAGMTIRGSQQGAIYFADGLSGNEAYRGRIEYKHATDSLDFGTSGTATMVRINSDGNVIIGSNGSWSYPKPINAQGSSGSIISLSNADTGTYAADTNTAIEFKLRTGNTGNQEASCEIRAFKENGTNGNSARALSFYTGINGGSPTERLRIKSSGEVGINATSPDCMLHVAKASAGTVSADVNAVLALENSNHCVLNMMSPADKSAYIMMGDPDDINAGQIRYDNNINELLVEVNGSERLRIDDSGKVGIGSSSPSAKLEVSARGDTEKGIRLTDPNNAQSAPYIEVIGNRGDGNSSQGFSGKLHLARHRSDEKVTVGNMLGAVAFGGNHTDGDPSNILYTASISAIASDDFDSSTDMPTDLIFLTGSTGRTPTAVNITTGSEKVRITAGGRTYVNTTSPIDGNSMVAIVGQFGTGGCGVEIKHDGNPASNRDFIRFFNSANSEAGSIEHNASTSVSFKTSSDHRLKENIADITDGIERLKLLKPRKFSWIDDPELGLRDGFIAHEVSPVIPHCVSGEKDAVKEDGSIHTQTMEYSQLTPLLTAALQESIAKIEVLEAEVAALKSS